MEKISKQNDIEIAILEVALSLENIDAQREFLERTYSGDAAGLKKMQGLMGSARASTSFFLEAREARGLIASEVLDEIFHPDVADPVTPIPLSERIGSWIGEYQILRCLGEGGSGIVFEVEQKYPVQRRVALKILRVDNKSGPLNARFDIERQALAMMDHPNIAKVLDAGGIHEGRPYFVMELVEGEPITTYCDRVKMGIAQRIQIFIDVCSAIQHAHSKRIIHRDIKPSNVLITLQDHKPVAKVIDFGIAKAAEKNRRISPVLTSHDQFVGTPTYMSPEQVEMIGVDVDTRSDVYSLGVLLYEILTSLTPFDQESLVNSGVANMRKTLLNKPHPKPSSRLAEVPEKDAAILASARRSVFPKLVSAIRGDLDWVVMKALKKDRNQRYQTANCLASDLKRYLGNKPVSARRPSNLYALGKFIERNKVPFYSAVAVAISVLMGLGTATTLYVRERAALNEQERLSHEAERSRDQELHLRRQAQARANVSRVAFLLSEGQIQEADELLQGNPLVSVEPSKEASSVFRSLGNWYGTYGRWEEAVQCFRLMNQATRMNNKSEILGGSDLLVTAPALLEFGDRPGYELFRNDVVNKYLPASNSLEAEHILKACLLVKATPSFLAKLEGAALLCEQSLNGKTEARYPAWEAFSLVLYHYRKNDFEAVLKTGQQGLALPRIKEICAACIRSLMAVAHYRLGNKESAAADLEWAASVVKGPSPPEVSEEKVIFPRWYDWAVGSLLLEEAEKIVGSPRLGPLVK